MGFKETGPHPYPHKFNITISLTEFVERFQGLEPGSQINDQIFSVAGKLLQHGNECLSPLHV